MKQLRLISLLITLAGILFSCTEGERKKSRSSGKTAEILVVTKTKDDWSGNIGKTVIGFFSQDYEVLPQSEPVFSLANIPYENFESNNMFQGHHNILIIDIGKDKGKPSIEVRKNVWAIPQRVILLTAATEEDLIVFFQEKKDVLFHVFMTCEYERLTDSFKSFINKDIGNELKKDIGLNLVIPEGFYVAKKSPDFIWIRKETNQFSQGLMIYRYDFTDTSAFDLQRIIAYRNSITEANIPGPSEGSYMQIGEEFFPVVSKRIDFNGMFAVETRGLWELKSDFMGGPFVNYTMVDEKKNKVVTLDAYVYAPNAPKRDLMIQMEAIIHSLSFAD